LPDIEHLRAKLFQNLARRPDLCFQQPFSNHAVKPPQIAGYRRACVWIQELRKIMDLELDNQSERKERLHMVFESAGGFSPTVGIIGAVLGLIQVMQHLDKMDEVGRGIAVAFVATIYGVAAANLVFLSAAGKLRIRWLVSYADFITLLFAFFVVMYSAAQLDKRRAGQLATRSRRRSSNTGLSLPCPET
jgi:hypothetical protein